MNETLWVFLGSLGANVIVGAFVYGKLTERVSSQGKRLVLVERDVKDHATRIAVLETKQGAKAHHGSI